MCRSIRPLFNYEPPAGEQDIHAAALQFVRKISGYHSPSTTNRAAFDRAVAEVASASVTLLGSLSTSATPRDRAAEAEKARERARERYARPSQE